jgi:ribosomal protein S18 acetylase RimI-like enzyme
MDLLVPRSEEHLSLVRHLFREYQESQDSCYCFESFEEELARLPGEYGPPTGRLILALDGGRAAGCVAMKPIAAEICEMKRLYVPPAFRGRSLGRRLAEAVIEAAREIGYARMRLETLPSMKEAQALYAKLGFERLEPSRGDPPVVGILMERTLAR